MSRESLVSIIDDDESVRCALGSLIRSLGYRVEIYDSADAYLDRGIPGAGCVLTDIQMPGISGIELKRRLDAMHCADPVILMTARSEADLHARAQACGAHALLCKPFSIDMLLNCLESAIGKPS